MENRVFRPGQSMTRGGPKISFDSNAQEKGSEASLGAERVDEGQPGNNLRINKTGDVNEPEDP
ncbi:hypothetical protein VM1G_11892 [Cytospora mali]|uniref:Uncharacterized protein n=1 Tax=Cytospora mali TaxID=578113 RepID=A0A194WBF4_CYTMA|nr:hypothetical protein VM1G_11892 [Valsa mali]